MVSYHLAEMVVDLGQGMRLAFQAMLCEKNMAVSCYFFYTLYRGPMAVNHALTGMSYNL